MCMSAIFMTNSTCSSCWLSTQVTNYIMDIKKIFCHNLILNSLFTSTYSPGVFEVGRHLSSAHFSHKRPKHDALLKVTLGIDLHLSHVLLATRSGTWHPGPNVPAQAQAGRQGQHRPGGAAVEPGLSRRQHCVRDIVLVWSSPEERDILEEFFMV